MVVLNLKSSSVINKMLTYMWCSFALFFIICLLDCIRYKLRSRKYMKDIPGPTYLPLIGTVLEISSTEEVISAGEKFSNIFGPVLKANVSLLEILIVSDEKWIEFFMNSTRTIKKSAEYKLMENWLGQGLLTSAGQKWHKDRKFLTPSFHFNIITQYMDRFNKASEILIEKLAGEVGKDAIDIESFVTLCSLDIICESIMGISINAQTNATNAYVESVGVMKDTIYRRTISIWKLSDWLYPLSRDYWKEKRALKIIHNTTDSVIKKRRQFLLENPEIENITENNNETTKKRLSFLDILLKGSIDGRPLTNQEIREQVDTFLFEGHDTTASAISFTLYCLARNPEIQEKVFKEIQAILGDDKTTPPTYQNLQDMSYLTLVIKESLRLFPSVPIVARTIEEDIEFDGKLLPKGLTIIIPLLFLHVNSKHFKDPFVFNPENFTTENRKGKHPYSYIPFSAGFRNCIGQKFAMLELKAVISKVVRNYKLLSVPGFIPHFKGDIILKCRNGVQVRLEERN